MGYCVRCAVLKNPEGGYHDGASYMYKRAPHNADHREVDHPLSDEIEWCDVEALVPADLALLPGRQAAPPEWKRVVYVYPSFNKPGFVTVMDQGHRHFDWPLGKRIARRVALPVPRAASAEVGA